MLRVCSDASPIARRVDDFDRSIEHDTRCDIEHEAVGEERGIERGKGPYPVFGGEADAVERSRPLARRTDQTPDRDNSSRNAVRQTTLAVPCGDRQRPGGRHRPAARRQHRCFSTAADRDSASFSLRRLGKPCRAKRSRPCWRASRSHRGSACVIGKRIEIRPRLGLHRKIDDRAHRCLTPQRRRRSRGVPARRRGSCRRFRRCGRLAAHAPGRARRNRAGAGNG